MSYIYGIDVAKWNGVIDWSKVYASGKRFAILKVTQKDNKVEEAFERNYFGATNNGLLVGVYRYVYAKTVAEATAEANAIVNVLKGRTLPVGIWLDMEDASIKKIGKQALWNVIATETKILRKSGYAVGIYCNKDWYDNVLSGSELAIEFPFWIARYPSTDNGTIKESLNPRDLRHCTAWQYSSKGKVNGVPTLVDLDVVF